MTTHKRYVQNQSSQYFLIFVFGLCFLIVSEEIQALSWLGVYNEKNLVWNNTKMCQKIRTQYGLTSQQVRLCRKFSDVMPYVHQAAQLAVSSCQTMFEFRRWNCSSIKFLPHLVSDLTSGTKEQAILYALSSAALTYTIARACATASISNCSCSQHPDDPPNGNFKWGGCGDNVKWGIQFSRQFMDHVYNKKVISVNNNKQKTRIRHARHMKSNNNRMIRENIQNIQHNELLSEINFHNGKIGRKLLLNNMVIHCKCHGVSGSCSIKTCWKGLPSKFTEISEKLMQTYHSAMEVHPSQLPSSISRYNDLQALLYITKSPDYCKKDVSAGIPGTSGRICNSTASDHTNCGEICCGRGYKSNKEIIKERCLCRYVSCCYVQCSTCNKTKFVDICN